MSLDVINNIAFVTMTICSIVIIRFIVNRVLGYYYKKIAVNTKGHFDDEFIPLLKRMFNVLFPILGLIVILSHYGLDSNILLSLGGAGTLAIGLIVKDSVKNIIAGLTLMIDKPFKVGDHIKIPTGEIGEVRNIGLRRTKIAFQDIDNKKPAILVLQNCDISKAKIVNYSMFSYKKS